MTYYKEGEELLKEAKELFIKYIPKTADGYSIVIRPYLSAKDCYNFPIQRFIKGLSLKHSMRQNKPVALTYALNERSVEYKLKDGREHVVSDVNRFLNDLLSYL